MTDALCEAVEHVVEFDTPDKHGTTRRDHLRQAGATVDDPEIPAAVAHVWAWFWRLDRARGAGFYAPQPISYIDIRAWSEMTGERPTPWEVETLRRMDDAMKEARAKPDG